MELALVTSTFALGLAGAPHCTAMCAAPCAAAVGRSGAGGQVGFQAARLASYAAAGAMAAAGVGWLAAAAQAAPLLRLAWTALHAAAFALGLWLLWTGRQPEFLAHVGRVPQPAVGRDGWQRIAGPTRAVAAGAMWAAWPCGLLQSALMVAALAPSALGGAAAMAAFGVASSAGLLLAPWVWGRLGREGGAAAQSFAVRGAGLVLAAMAGWALTHGLWERVVAYCATWW